MQILAYYQSLKSHNSVTVHCNVTKACLQMAKYIRVNDPATFWCKVIEDM